MNQNQNRRVWVAERCHLSGIRSYHPRECRYVKRMKENGEPTQIPESKAIERGLSECGVCADRYEKKYPLTVSLRDAVGMANRGIVDDPMKVVRKTNAEVREGQI